jgi:HK97 family phage major capsid protein
MTRDELARLEKEADQLLGEMRNELDSHPDGMTGEAAEKYSRLEGDLDKRMKNIDAGRKLIAASAELSPAEARSIALPATDPVDIDDEAEPVEEKRYEATAAYERAFSKFLRRDDSPELRAAMNKGTASQGGYLVPETWGNELISSLVAQSPVLGLARQFQTSSGEPFHIPVVNYVSTPLQRPNLQSALIAEAGSYAETEDTLTEVKFSAFKYGTVAKVSDELIRDSLFNVDQFIREQAAKTLGYTVGSLIATGDGSSKPTGYNTSTNTVTAASASVITADELISVQHQVGVPYRNNAVWVMSDSALQAARKLKDSYGRYILQSDWATSAPGAPSVLLGKPVFVDPFLPTVATGNAHTAYGDFSVGVGVRRVAGINIKPLLELYAGNGQIGYRIDLSFDSKLLDTAAIATYKQA